jgi:hypothetical protein
MEQLADSLTKPLGHVRFLELHDKIGTIKIKRSTTGLRV